jgi:hypothetical protein
MAVKKVVFKRILRSLGLVLLLCVLALLGLIWRSMSLTIEAVPAAEAEETFTLRFDDVSMDVPKSFKIDILNISLNWPEARILVREKWCPDSEEALKQFMGAQEEWAERHGEVIDISETMGFPALMVPQIAPIDLAEKPVMMVSLVRENVQLNFILLLPETHTDPEPWKAALISRARDFALFYQPSPVPGFVPEAGASEVRTIYGTVKPGPRAGYVVSPNFINLTRDNQVLYISNVTRGERFMDRPGFSGTFSRFFQNLSSTGVISGIELKERSLDALAGHEILWQHPYLGQGPKVYDFNWQEVPQTHYGKWLSLVAGELSPAEAPAVYGQWQQILESVRFTK